MRHRVWALALLMLAGCHDNPQAPLVPATGPRASLGSDGNVINLGSLSGQGASGAYAINDRGQVVGYSSGGFPSFSCCRGFLWEAGVMQDLGSLRPDGAGNVLAWDLNDAGQVVGYSTSPSSPKSAFLWQNGAMQDLGASLGGESEARGINATGAVVGFTGQIGFLTHAWLWTPANGMQLLPDFPDPGYPGTIAEAVNDQLMVVGQANTVNGTNPIGRAFVWTPTGGMVDPGLPPHGLYVSFEDVNNAGQAVGYAWMDATLHFERHAVRWSAVTGWEDLAVTLDPFEESWAHAIAPDGTAGGQGDFSGIGCSRQDGLCGMVWTPNGTVIRLPTTGNFFQPNAVVYGLNGQGQAVGYATFSGFPGATLWTIPGAMSGNPTAATGGPYTAPEGSVVAFDGGASFDPQGDPLTLTWNFGDSSAFGSGVTPTHTYADNYIVLGLPYTTTLYARDPAGAMGAATTTVMITNVAPALTVVAPDSLKATVAGTVTLQFSDPGLLDAPWKLRLDWGDGTAPFTASSTTQGSVSATHSYAAAGSFQLVARVVDKDSGATADTVPLRVVPFNRAPVASAGGPYAVTEGTPLGFDASHSRDPDGDALTFAWDFGDGATGSGPAPQHTYLRAGSYTVTLTATDGQGLSNAATATVAVSNLPPVVFAGADTTIAAGSFGWSNGTFSDPGSGDGPWIENVDWGNGVSSGNMPIATVGSLKSTGLGFNTPGVYTVTVTVTDAGGLSASDQFVITVTGNGGPIAKTTGPYSGNEGVGIAMSSAGTVNPGGTALTYRWTFGDGTAAATTANPTHIYADNGSYTVTLKVTDAAGRSSTATTTATVANVAPTATFTKPASVAEGAKFTLSLTVPKDVVPDKNAGFQYAFNCGSGFGGFTAVANIQCPARPDNGSVTVGGQIRDKDGGVRTYSGAVTVTNAVPKVTISASTPTTMTAGTTFGLNGSFTDPGTLDAPWSYSIAWGDGTATTNGTGTPGTVIAAAHRYTKVGSWIVKMTVTDKNGGKGISNAVTVTVQ